jgi:DNA-binding protein|tara:strand:- start:1990 stop:2382 length:393 start_codon:yes stop_codon:yes gene_type:complete
VANNKNKKPEKSKPKKTNKRRFRINKKLDGNVGTIFIGAEDPFMYFPDMMSYLDREEIKEVKLKARGKSISNAVNVTEQFRNRFKKDIGTIVKNVEIGTENVPKKDGKGTFRMSFIEITLAADTKKENTD